MKNNQTAGVAAYVMIMFGMILMLYLFGFHSLWADYQGSALGGSTGTAIDNSAVDFGIDVLNMIGESITKSPQNIGLMAGGAIAVVGLFIIGRLTNSTATILQFLIPVLLLVILNIFIFPISGLSTDVGFMNAAGAEFTIFLFAFFNLFYILAMLVFIRGQPT